MDTTPVYTKMCMKAEEIQLAWKPIPGDFCEKSYSQGVDTVASVSKDVLFFPEDVGFDYIVGEEREECIWLPRQDQLQEMVGGNHWVKHYHFQTFINDILGWEIMKFNLNLDNYTSLEQAWLAYVMWGTFKKLWNGEDWVTATYWVTATC